jgi:hypothetical protein
MINRESSNDTRCIGLIHEQETQCNRREKREAENDPQEKGGELLGVEGSVEGKRYRAKN